MINKKFLCWVHERLVMLGDSRNMDFMHKLRAIIRDTDTKLDSRPGVDSDFDVDELWKELPFETDLDVVGTELYD